MPAGAGRAALHQSPAATGVIGVLGDVGQHREVAERPDHVERIGDLQWVEQFDQPCGISVADGSPSDGLDEIECCVAGLVGDHFTERPTQQADVVVERLRRQHLARIGAGGQLPGRIQLGLRSRRNMTRDAT